MLLTVDHELTRDEDQLAILLIWSIVLLAVASLSFIVATFWLRIRKIKRLGRIRFYQKQAEEVLFPLLFGMVELRQAIDNYRSFSSDALAKSVLIRSVSSLHQNYSGAQKALLEAFFVESGLHEHSLRKIHSRRWDTIVEGIRELSTLNVHQAFPDIKELIGHPNKLVQKEAFIGVISLEGVAVLKTIPLPGITIDDWTQSCILHNLGIRQETRFDELSLLFESGNESLIVLAARMVENFQLYAFYEQVLNMDFAFSSPRNRSSMAAIRKHLDKQTL